MGFQVTSMYVSSYNQMVPALRTLTYSGGNNTEQGTVINATKYIPIDITTSEVGEASVNYFRAGTDSTVLYVWCYVSTNTIANPSTLTFRAAGADKGTITITASTTGFFSTSGLSNDISASDAINWKIIGGNDVAGNVNIKAAGALLAVRN